MILAAIAASTSFILAFSFPPHSLHVFGMIRYLKVEEWLSEPDLLLAPVCGPIVHLPTNVGLWYEVYGYWALGNHLFSPL